jgi:glycosyltransferase involved in cell wall biosynthesis
VIAGEVGSSRGHDPVVSIGLPVYNGENFLSQALQAHLDQTFEEWELIIADNASSDGTEEIAREFTARDKRISYYRQPHNLGAAPNYNFVFDQATGQYFKWSAHDDLIDPRFLERCIKVLEEEPAAVLAYTRTEVIDEHGRTLRTGPLWPAFSAPEPHLRVQGVLESRRGALVEPVFGVMRTAALRTTRLHGSYTGSDTTLMMELALRGPFVEIPDTLFRSREHDDRSIRLSQARGKKGHVREGWFDTRRQNKIVFPAWRRVQQMATAIPKAGLRKSEAAHCFLAVAKSLGRWYWKPMVRDLGVAGRQLVSRVRVGS